MGVQDVKPKFPGGSDPAAEQHTELIFFVHGYNNIMSKAEDVWLQTLQLLVSDGASNHDLRKVVLFYWPGDVGRYRLLSAPFYSLMIKAAKKTAEKLADYLKRLRSPDGQKVRLRFVAHSLGCRVVLEALAQLHGAMDHIEVEDLLLMAAAVPAGLCTKPRAFSQWFSRWSEQALYSSRDRVLQLFFMPGQAMAGDLPEDGREAVGRCGKPIGRWRPITSDTHLGHGEYWRHKPTVARIGKLISPARYRERKVEGREISQRASSIEPWQVSERVLGPTRLVDLVTLPR
jgi:pimeloyl-ACP methyl ester carboxylesterase